MSAPLYNTKILRLAAAIPHQERLEAPHASVVKTSPICGSRVTVDVNVNADGRVEDFGQEVRACALGQASAALLGARVVGMDVDALAASAAELRAFLDGAGKLSAANEDLAIFTPARPHKARHASILLAWDAAAEAARSAGQA
ncbi:MAG: iron-sulfur cluster assembly scaffold protein [Pseudomonadota bacterium]